MLLFHITCSCLTFNLPGGSVVRRSVEDECLSILHSRFHGVTLHHTMSLLMDSYVLIETSKDNLRKDQWSVALAVLEGMTQALR